MNKLTAIHGIVILTISILMISYIVYIKVSGIYADAIVMPIIIAIVGTAILTFIFRRKPKGE
jgi:ATP/ADP translocase